MIEKYNATAKELLPLPIGTPVVIQNRKHNKKWIKSGKVVESLGHRQYHIKLDGSGRITLQNRRYLRRSIPTKQLQLTPSAPLPQHSHQAPNLAQPQLLPPQLQPTAANIPEATPTPSPTAQPQTPLPKVPRALKNLQSFNNPGQRDIPQWRE